MFNRLNNWAPWIASAVMMIISGLSTIRDSRMESFLRWAHLGGILDFVYTYYAWIWAGAIVVLAWRWLKNPWVLFVLFLVSGLFIRFILLGF